MKMVLLGLFIAGVSCFVVPLTVAQTMIERVPMKEIGGFETVKVSINGTGPYDFILDTGANVTLVKERVFQQLHITGTRPITIVTATDEGRRQQATAESIAIGGLSVERLEINVLKGADVSALGGEVHGILGENFLKNFDILIDNEQHQLTLDRSSSLADTLVGEHLHFSRFGNFNSEFTRDRIIVELKINSFRERPSLFLVDSGASTALLYPAPGSQALGAMQGAQHGGLRDLVGASHNCASKRTTLEMGTSVLRGLELLACEGVTRNKMDTDGLLPTDVFRRLFISHRGGYLIANPDRQIVR